MEKRDLYVTLFPMQFTLRLRFMIERATHAIRLQWVLWQYLFLYCVWVTLFGWGPWDKYYQYTYTLPRSAGLAVCLYTLVNLVYTFYPVNLQRRISRQFLLITACATTMWIFDEERRLRAAISQSDEMEVFVQRIHTVPKGEIVRARVLKISNPNGLNAVGNALKFTPDNYWKGVIFLCPDKFTEYKVNFYQKGQKQFEIYLLPGAHALRWHPMNDDVYIEASFLDEIDCLLKKHGHRSLKYLTAQSHLYM